MTKNNENLVKNYARRDSATAQLRKLGVPASEYSNFIEVLDDGTFNCYFDRVEEYLNSRLTTGAKKPKKTVQRVEKQGGAPKAEKAREQKDNVSAVARELILAGKTNSEVWVILKKKFNLDDSKKHYPTWYRCEMKRKGLIGDAK